jgi:hypothetical protein
MPVYSSGIDDGWELPQESSLNWLITFGTVRIRSGIARISSTYIALQGTARPRKMSRITNQMSNINVMLYVNNGCKPKNNSFASLVITNSSYDDAEAILIILLNLLLKFGASMTGLAASKGKRPT